MGFYEQDTFEPDCSVGYLIRRCHQMGQGALEPVFARRGITGSQWQALVSIYFGRGATSAELARDIGHDKGAMTRLVDSMEASGWITRSRNCEDRRVVTLTLTEAGREVAVTVKADIVACWNAWLKEWNGDDVTTLITLLQRLRGTLDAVEGGCA